MGTENTQLNILSIEYQQGYKDGFETAKIKFELSLKEALKKIREHTPFEMETTTSGTDLADN